MYKILTKINKPNDVRRLKPKYYELLAEEVRHFLIENVSKTGGHLASNLGAVELTIALHATLDVTKDRIVWDVGHQSYTHKLLTGRREEFQTLRQYRGMSGFPKRRESITDAFDTGHSSTSISAALGIAAANQMDGNDQKVVAVIGDGALTGGLALEALNNVSALNRNFIIVLNDNEMSISENVGGLSNYLNKFRLSSHYNDLKEDIYEKINKIPNVGKSMSKGIKEAKNHLRNIVVPENSFFDEWGITYIGPVDGHNIEEMTHVLRQAYKINHPILIHIKTKKGKGYSFAEQNPTLYHGVGPFDKNVGVIAQDTVTYTDVFSKKIIEKAQKNKDIVAITAAMPEGTGLNRFHEAFPNRFFDVGIAEEHAVTFAAGMAANGKKPVVSIYSSFYQRAYDQIVHDVCLQKLPVIMVVDRAGLVGNDGETHQGIFDISFMSAIPNLTIIAPNSREELELAIDYAIDFDGPIAIRFPRGKAYNANYELEKMELGKSQIVESGKDVCLIAVGGIFEEAAKAYEKLYDGGINIALVNARFIKPFDKELADNIIKNYKKVVIVEEAIKKGGYAQEIENYIYSHDRNIDVITMAIEDEFVEHGSVSELREQIGISSEKIYKKVKEII